MISTPGRSIRSCCLTWIVGAALATSACQPSRSGSTDTTYAGETIRIVVGFAAGGTYDLQSRLLARHLGKHLAGQPTVVVENMPGAGGAVAANYLANVAAADGTTIAMLAEANAADMVSSDIVNQLRFLGGPASGSTVFVFSRRSGIASIEDWRNSGRAPRFASSGARAFTSVVPRVAAAALRLPIKVVSGYAGSAEMRLALEGGEVDAICLTWDSLQTLFGTLSDVNVIMRFSKAPIPGVDLPDAMALAADADARQLLETGVYAMAPLGKFVAVRRGVTESRVRMLREALAKTWGDPDFLAEARTAGLTIEPVTADALEQSARAVSGRREIVSRIDSILSEQ